MAAIAGKNSGRGPRTIVHRRNQPTKSQPALYKPLLHFHSHLKISIHKQQAGVPQSQRWYGMHWHTHIKVSKEELAWAADKHLWVICDQIREETCTAHTPDFVHLDILKTTGNGIQT